MKIHNAAQLVKSLCEMPRETGWLEFKENKFNEDSVGQYISSLANPAMLEGKDAAYMVFGVEDETHKIVGTSVDLLGEKVGSEDLILWLNKCLEPHITISVETADIEGKRVEILCIDPGYRQPVKFKKVAYVRIGSAQQPLSNYPERERTLWQITSRYSFETSLLNEHFTFTEIEERFSIDILLTKIGKKKPTRREKAEFLIASGLIRSDMQGQYEISALLAIAAARDLTEFRRLRIKVLA